MRLLELDTLSDQNITSALLVGSYTADADRKIMVQVFIKQVAGNGTYYAYVTHDPLASGTFYEVSPRTSASVPSGVTSIAFTTIPLAVLNTDIVRVYVIGLAGDTTTPDITVRWLEDDSVVSSIWTDALATMLADDTYQAKVELFDDDENVTDHYAVVWFKNAQPITSGITVPTIQVIEVADGSNLIASTAMIQVAALGLYRYNAVLTERIVSGVAYIAKVTATIDGSTRTWFQPIGRDS